MPNEGSPKTRLYVFCGVCFVMAFVYGLLGATPNPGLGVLLSVGPPIAVTMWLVRDSRLQRIATVHDAGLLFYVTWPLLMPWYALKTRGRAGWALVGQLYALALAGFAGIICGGLIGLIWQS
ncbi:MAG: hypothetical protein ABI679_15625 [Gemmatimonadota bacterium]